ncbi:MAG: Xaa-Pro aminopeptidase [Rhodothermales bacterium]|jgi:Xaa-Pro aminopeptidase
MANRFFPGLVSLLLLLVGFSVDAQAQTQTPEQRYLKWAEPHHPADVYVERRARLLDQLGDEVLLIPSYHGASDGTSFRQLDDFWYLTGLELPSSMLALDGRTGVTNLFVPERDTHFESASRPNDFPGRPLLGDTDIWERVGLNSVLPMASLDGWVDRSVASGRLLAVQAGRGASADPPTTSWFLNWGPVDGLLDHLHQTWPDAKVVNAHDAMARVRMIKGPEEIETIRRVVDLTAQAIEHAAGFIAPDVTERDLEAELEGEYKRHGAQRLAFASIIKSGPNSLWPWRVLAAHYDRRNRAMEAGELVIFDVGTELDGYVSDVGRTFPVSGQFSNRQREILKMEVGVADAIIAAMKPGVTLLELMDVARAATPDQHEQYMQAGLFFGHYIGMSTGDPALYDVPLAAGMVITVEPWYYNHDEGISVFTEDVILVTETGVDVLSSRLPRSPEDLERLVGRR